MSAIEKLKEIRAEFDVKRTDLRHRYAFNQIDFHDYASNLRALDNQYIAKIDKVLDTV